MSRCGRLSQLLSRQEPSGYLLTHKLPVPVLADMDTVFPLCPRCLFLCPGQVLCFAYASVWSMELIPLKTNSPSSLPSCTFCFFWLSDGSDHCAITQRVVPASRGWEARNGLILLVAVAAAGVTVTLEAHTNHHSRAGKNHRSLFAYAEGHPAPGKHPLGSVWQRKLYHINTLE